MSLFLPLPAVSCPIAASASRCDLSARVRNCCAIPPSVTPHFFWWIYAYQCTHIAPAADLYSAVLPLAVCTKQTGIYFASVPFPVLELTIYPPSVAICSRSASPLPPPPTASGGDYKTQPGEDPRSPRCPNLQGFIDYIVTQASPVATTTHLSSFPLFAVAL